MENTNSSQALPYFTDLQLVGTLAIPIPGKVQIQITRKYSVESHIITRLWVFEEIGSY